MENSKPMSLESQNSARVRLRVMCRQSFDPKHQFSKQYCYVDNVREIVENYGLPGMSASQTIVLEFTKAVSDFAKALPKMDMIRRFRHRRWLITQGRKWGIDAQTVHYALSTHGANFWTSGALA